MSATTTTPHGPPYHERKVKVLLCGAIVEESRWKTLFDKLTALQSSAAGPFDAAFIVSYAADSARRPLNDWKWPLPVYFSVSDESISETDSEPKETEEHNNFFLLSSNTNGRSWRLQPNPQKPPIAVVTLPKHYSFTIQEDPAVIDTENMQEPLLEAFQQSSYLGCDLLFSHEWPEQIHSVLSPEAEIAPKTSSPAVRDLARLARPRYHVVSASIPDNEAQTTATGSFQQSRPFEQDTATPLHVGRFLALAPVRPVDEITDKAAQKYIHALGFVPLQEQTQEETLAERPKGAVAPCPYLEPKITKVMSHTLQSIPGESAGHLRISQPNLQHSSNGFSAAMAQQIQREESGNNGSFRWNTGTRQKNHDTTPPDSTTTTLFIHGLHHDVTGRLQLPQQGDVLLLQHFHAHGVQQVRRPPNVASSSFAFLEFGSHEAAATCLATLGPQVTVSGIPLTLKWGNKGTKSSHESKKGTAPAQEARKTRLTEAEARDSSTIFFRFTSAQDQQHRGPETVEILRQYMETTLEDALAVPGTGEGDAPVTVSAATEPALQVTTRQPDATRDYGFLEFASHAAASMALATLTGSTDGGLLLEEASRRPPVLTSVALHWAPGIREGETTNGSRKRSRADDMIEDPDSGFKFQRKHFPADTRSDCWFCLGSESCEKHLITGVYNACYTAMPKGPIHQGHVLIVPVEHTSRGALYDASLSEEMDDIKQKLRLHALETYDREVMVFERAISTSGGYHTHVQCVPVPRGLGSKIELTLKAQAAKNGIHPQLREITGDLPMSAVLRSSDGQDDGYFYVEVPGGIGGYKDVKRFLYQPTNDNGDSSAGGHSRSSVPIQFGREIIAAVFNDPQLAHWKSCVLDTEKEKELATELRQSLAAFENKPS
jgi:Protein similar to CwfJ C-terminus 1